jgi:hypothetical protein
MGRKQLDWMHLTFADWPPEYKKLIESNYELTEQTDRGCAIVGGSIVQAELINFLTRCLKNRTQKTRKLFTYDGAIGAFSHQITLAYGFGLIDENVYGDLVQIKDIRNKFAHYVHLAAHEKDPETLVTFDHVLIKQWALSLRAPFVSFVAPENDPQRRFVITCCALRSALSAVGLTLPAAYLNPRSSTSSA